MASSRSAIFSTGARDKTSNLFSDSQRIFIVGIISCEGRLGSQDALLGVSQSPFGGSLLYSQLIRELVKWSPFDGFQQLIAVFQAISIMGIVDENLWLHFAESRLPFGQERAS